MFFSLNTWQKKCQQGLQVTHRGSKLQWLLTNSNCNDYYYVSDPIMANILVLCRPGNQQWMVSDRGHFSWPKGLCIFSKVEFSHECRSRWEPYSSLPICNTLLSKGALNRKQRLKWKIIPCLSQLAFKRDIPGRRHRGYVRFQYLVGFVSIYW